MSQKTCCAVETSCCATDKAETSCCATDKAEASCCATDKAEASCCATDKAEAASCCSPDETESVISVAPTVLTFKDALGAWKVRWGIGRDNYTVEPGLYSVGKPDSNSPVLVSANYKLTFDTVRKNLTGTGCWLLILDTKGINVWCAAGKGTFGTDELIKRIEAVGLHEVVEHRKLILPQLGATGVSAHEVFRQSGFTVTYGPVRASDIQDYIANDYQATEGMRTVQFTLWDRMVVTPMEIVEAAKISIYVFAVMFIINLFASRPFGIQDFIVYASSVLAGAVLTPIFLPFIPGKIFAFKGWLVGVIGIFLLTYHFGWFAQPYYFLGIGYMFALPAYSAFLAMNFTGASTYTSFSGVIKEMKIAIPVIVSLFLVGIIMIMIITILG